MTLYELTMAVGLQAAAKLELLRSRLGDTPSERELEDVECGCCGCDACQVLCPKHADLS
jgi:hypothetical protein